MQHKLHRDLNSFSQVKISTPKFNSTSLKEKPPRTRSSLRAIADTKHNLVAKTSGHRNHGGTRFSLQPSVVPSSIPNSSTSISACPITEGSATGGTADLVSDRQTIFGDPRPRDRRNPIQNALTRIDSNGDCGVHQSGNFSFFEYISSLGYL